MSQTEGSLSGGDIIMLKELGWDGIDTGVRTDPPTDDHEVKGLIDHGCLTLYSPENKTAGWMTSDTVREVQQ